MFTFTVEGKRFSVTTKSYEGTIVDIMKIPRKFHAQVPDFKLDNGDLVQVKPLNEYYCMANFYRHGTERHSQVLMKEALA